MSVLPEPWLGMGMAARLCRLADELNLSVETTAKQHKRLLPKKGKTLTDQDIQRAKAMELQWENRLKHHVFNLGGTWNGFRAME